MIFSHTWREIFLWCWKWTKFYRTIFKKKKETYRTIL